MHVHACTNPYTHTLFLGITLDTPQKKEIGALGGLNFFSYSQNTDSTFRSSPSFLTKPLLSCFLVSVCASKDEVVVKSAMFSKSVNDFPN